MSDRYTLHVGDCREWLRTLPDDGADLLFTSPPYEAARTYGIDFKLRGQAWVDWMVEVITLAAPKVKGLIAINCEGQTRGYKYSATPFLLMADLHRAGFNLRKPVVFHRNGIFGGGGQKAQHEANGGSADWLRNDWEPVLCITRKGKLPWADALACGHAPKWAPGGEASHRQSNGARRNQWGKSPGQVAGTKGNRKSDGSRDSLMRAGDGPCVLVRGRNQWGEIINDNKVGERRADGKRMKRTKPSHKCDGSVPAIANPGNVIKLNVGGGHLGHDLAHENEAPFPLDLAAFFVKSFCPPDGLVIDPFCGSSTTGHAAIEHGRRFAGCDIRQSQVDLSERRLRSVTPPLFSSVPA